MLVYFIARPSTQSSSHRPSCSLLLSQAHPLREILRGGLRTMGERFPDWSLHVIQVDINDDDDDTASHMRT